MSPGDLAEPHADLEGITQCTKCHEAGRGVSAKRCLACHDEIAGEVDANRGYHATLGDRCERCHPDHRGRSFAMVRFDPETFDHVPTGFPLEGAHADTACADCHRDTGTWRGLSPVCRECHADPHGVQASSRKLLARCEACHDSAAWAALPIPTSVFRHDDREHADYPLEGLHADVECEKCHADWRFVPVAHGQCTDCHGDPHKGSQGPVCSNCHRRPTSWRVSSFDHSKTDFPLEGLHADVACHACHGRDTTRPVAHEACADCHEDPHLGQFAPRGCAECHTVDQAGFHLPDFDHDVTGWPLRGEHLDVECAACHGEPVEEAVYAGLPGEDCAACHDDAHDGRFAPTPCRSCHVETGWKAVADFDHGRTDFPLLGSHAEVACEGCHTDTWAGLPHGSCLDCHAEDDPHGPGLAGDTCEGCHDVASWADVTFDHAATGFLLEGAHDGPGCMDCHEQPDYTGQSAECEACHERPRGHYEGTCSECHQGTGWSPATFGDLGHAVTGFVLVGRHQVVECDACHVPGVPRGAAGTLCVDCHQDEDPHRHLLGDTCDDCHAPSSWHRTTFRHTQTGWPLRGGHRLAWCDDCHAAGYAGTPRDCWRCHESEASTSVSAHQTPEVRACDTCHHPFTWIPSGFPH